MTAVARLLAHTWWMIGRQLRNLMREPIWIALILIQPMIWLLLYGQLFKRDWLTYYDGPYVRRSQGDQFIISIDAAAKPTSVG